MLNFTYTSLTPCRLRTYLRQQGISGTVYKALRFQQGLTVNGVKNNRDVLLKQGDTVALTLPRENTTVVPTDGALTICYEDDYLLVVDKAAGMLIHPTTLHATGTLANLVAGYYQKHSIMAGLHPVSRLDKNTSGLVVFAKHAYLQYALSQANIYKEYLGIVQGTPEPWASSILAPIARKPGSIIIREVNWQNGAPAHTDYEVVKSYQNIALIKFILHTGRTHQIRVHASYIGHPLVGDNLYGVPGPQSRHLLHAHYLAFIHPYTKEKITLTSPLPADMITVLNQAKYAIINKDDNLKEE